MAYGKTLKMRKVSEGYLQERPLTPMPPSYRKRRREMTRARIKEDKRARRLQWQRDPNPVSHTVARQQGQQQVNKRMLRKMYNKAVREAKRGG